MCCRVSCVVCRVSCVVCKVARKTPGAIGPFTYLVDALFVSHMLIERWNNFDFVFILTLVSKCRSAVTSTAMV